MLPNGRWKTLWKFEEPKTSGEVGTIAHLKNSCISRGPGRLYYLQQERRAAAGRRSLSLVRIQEAESAAAVAEDTVR